MITIRVSPDIGVVVFGDLPDDLTPLLSTPRGRGGLGLRWSPLAEYDGELGGWYRRRTQGRPVTKNLPPAQEIAAVLRAAAVPVRFSISRRQRPHAHVRFELYERARARQAALACPTMPPLFSEARRTA
ncbi:hypothetical protein ACWDA3_59195 [Nonomuraea rubra]